MKKLILFLLLPLWAISQTSTTQEQEFDYGIKNNSAQTITTPPYLTTTGMDGTQGKIPSALIEKTENKQNSLAVDGTGTKYPTVDAVNAALPRNYTKVVYVNSTTPSTAAIFDDENPPVVNDDLLKSDVANLYIGTDASPWVWNGSTYETKVVPASSNFFVEGTTVDAGSSKNVNIQRVGSIKTSQSITAQNMNSSSVTANVITVNPETPNTIAYFDSQKQIKSLPTDTYPSLTELSYVKGVTSGIQSQINNKADLDGSGKVPLSQINDALLGSVNYKGTYNATTNVPAIPTATSSNKGWYYIISTAGTQQGFNFVNGDWIISNGTSWGKVDNNNAVTSVNGQVGAVSVTASSIGAQTTLTNPVTGTGTTNYIPKFTGSGTLGNSLIQELNYQSVAVGKDVFIEANGGVYMKATSGINYETSVRSINDGNDIAFVTNSELQSIIKRSGNMLFNTGIDNGVDKLQVNGSISATSYTGGATLTGTPTAPTAPVGTNTTQIATMEALQAANAGNVKTTGDQTKTGDLTLSGDSRLLSVVSADNETGYAHLGIDALGLPYMQLGTSSNENIAVIRADNINTVSVYQLPNSSGTIALQETVKPYKVYTALLSQTGTNAPTATVLENTLGTSISWTRNSDGNYTGTAIGTFTSGKTLVFVTNAFNGALYSFVSYSLEVNTVQVSTFYSGAPTDGLLEGQRTSIEIRVYN